MHPDAPGPDIARSEITSLALAGVGCPARTRQYCRGVVRAEGFSPAEIGARLQRDPESVVWLDLSSPGPSDLEVVRDVFECHPLALTDAVSPGQRVKVYHYRDHVFANVYVASPRRPDAPSGGTVELGEVSIFLTSRVLITVRKGDVDLHTFLERSEANSKLVGHGPESTVLAYSLFDSIVNGHHEAVERLDEITDGLERSAFSMSRQAEVRRQGYEVDVELADLRRVVQPMRDVIGRFVRNDNEAITDELVPYFHDLLDRALFNAEVIEANRDRVDRVVQTQLSEQGAQLNETTRRLAAWAAIIAVPTAVTGFYGQNVPFPGVGQVWGFVVSCAVIVVLAVGVYGLLRRKHWL